MILTHGLVLVLALRLTYENGLHQLITCTTLAFPLQSVNSGTMASCTPHLVTPHPSRLGRWRTDQWSLFSFLSFPLSFSPRALRMQADSLAPRNASLVAGSFARPPSSGAPFPVSPLPCLRSDTVWLVLWLVTVLQGPCQIFVLRESAGVALFRSLTVPLLGSVPSRCRCFTLLALFAWFLWLWVVSCGTGWASTSIDNL